MNRGIWENSGKRVVSNVAERKRIGIIAEDVSDFESFKVLVNRLTECEGITFERRVGGGSGKVKRKCLEWSKQLHLSGCSVLIVIHDLDTNDFDKLYSDIARRLKTSPIKMQCICIPVRELEAWFLSDPDSIKRTLKLKRSPKVPGNPESITSPKEYLKEQVRRCSHVKNFYLSTRHNSQLAGQVDVQILLRKCPSFRAFFNFIDCLEF